MRSWAPPGEAGGMSGPRMKIARCIHKKKIAETSVAVGWMKDQQVLSPVL